MNAHKTVLALAAAGVIGCLLALPNASIGQAQAAVAEDQRVAQLVRDVAAQQQKISDNQTAIDQQLATVAEDLRVARIYVSRTGGKAK